MSVMPKRRGRGLVDCLPPILVGIVVAGCGAVSVPPPVTISPVSTVAAAPTAAPAATTPRATPTVTATATPAATPSIAPAGADVPPGPGAVPSVALQAALGRFIRATGTPGVSVTIRWPDGHAWTGTAGVADVRHRTPVRPDTAFAVGSVSKTFTSAVVLQLVEEGRLRLDDPVAPYLPAQHLDRRITVRMLLDHTSGLYDVFLAPGIDKALQSAPAKRWSVVRALTYKRKAYFPPGRGWHYSNTNYLLLGLLAERITGNSLATEIQRRFLSPLALSRTWTQVAEPAAASLAHGYRVTGSRATLRQADLSDGTGIAPFTSVVTAIDGAGAVAATSADLATWAADLYGGRVLSAATLAEMVADQHRTVAYIPGVRYGLGVQVYGIGPWSTLGHSGRLLGFRGEMRYVPGLGISIAALTNQSRSDVRPLVAQLLAIILPARPSTRPHAR